MKYTTKMLALLLVLVMTVGVMAPAFAAEAPAAPSILDELTLPEAEEAAYADDEYVSVIVELASAAVMEVEEFADEYAANSVGFSMSSTAAEYRAQLANEQDSIQAQIAEVAEGALFRYSYTNLINGFNAYVQYGDIDAIKAIDGVSGVYLTQQYSAEDLWDDTTEFEFVSLEEYEARYGSVGVELADDPSADLHVDGSGYQTQLGLHATWDNGYTGAGKVAAIFDSGFYTDNQWFHYYDLAALQKQFPELNLDTDVNGGTVRTEAGIKQILMANKGTMNIWQSFWNDWFHSWEEQYPDELDSGFGENVGAKIEAGEFFVNDKIPFNVDYANGDFNTWIEPKTDDVDHNPAFTSVSNHGTHVAGIVAGNAGPDKEALSAVKGSAPDAQLFCFKIFKEQDGYGQEGDEDVFAALDDAVTLGVNVFNLSLGIPNGFSTYNNVAQAGYQRAYNSARNAGISIAVSAANDYREERSGALVNGYTTQIPNNSSVGASTSLFSPFTVASAQGIGYNAYNSSNYALTTATFMAGETEVAKVENLRDCNGPLSLGEEFTEAVELVWAGTKAEIAEAAAEAYVGKVAVVVYEGDYTVSGDALDKGAVATVMINNSNSNSNMSEIYLAAGSCFGRVKSSIGETLKAALAEGTVTVSFVTNDNDRQTSAARTYADNGPSGFTSWGVTEALRLTPDIMAPGGNILAAGSSHPNQLSVKSGTSMASPAMCGAFLLAQQYVDTLIADGGLLDDQVKAGTLEYATLVDNIIGSTALPYMPYDRASSVRELMRETEEGRYQGYYSPRRQGAGMAQLDKATATKTYLTSTMEVGYNLVTGESQRAKIELGELGMAQEFTMQYKVVNFDTVAHTYQVETALQTDATTVDGNGRTNIVTYGNYGDDVDTIEEAVITVEGVEGGSVVAASANINRFAEDCAATTVKVPAKSTAVVTVKVTLADMAAYDAAYPNGMFLEGYVFMDDNTRNAVAIDLSIPFIGFRGEWNDAPIFDYMNAYESRDNKAVSDLDYPIWHVDTLNTMNAETGVAVLGANQFTGAKLPYSGNHHNNYYNRVRNLRSYLDTLRNDGNMAGEWVSFSPNGDGWADDVYAQFALLRNAKMLGVKIVDAEGNLVKDLGYEWEYFECLASDGNESQTIQTTAYDKYGHALNWDGTNANGEKVADGQYYYQMSAVIESDYLDLVNADEVRAELNAFIKSLERTESLVNGPELQSIKDKLDALVGDQAKALLDNTVHTTTMPVKVDTVAPAIEAAYMEGVFTVNVSDEVGVQAVAMYYDGQQVGETVLINATEGTASFDVAALGEVDESLVEVQAVDFAMNVASANAAESKVVLELGMTAGADVTVDDKSVEFGVTAAKAANLATVTLKFEVNDVVANPVAVAAAGWNIITQTFEDGILEVVMFNVDGLTTIDAANILTITGDVVKVGKATVTLVDAVPSIYVGESEAYAEYVIVNGTATVNVNYSNFDVNRDGTVNQLDLTRAQRFFGKADDVCDVNDDGVVDIADIVMILNNYSK